VEGLVNSCPLLDYLSEINAPGAFLLLDVGCSGGIDRPWRRMGRRLCAIGIDPDIGEIERLRAREKNSAVTYENAFVGLAADHPLARQKRGRPDLERNPWARLSTARYMELVYTKGAEIAAKEKRSANMWREGQLADPAAPIILPDYLTRIGVTSLDFLKVDVDGTDYEILSSMDQALAQLRVLGVGIEVRFWGSHCETDGTFHNVDRLLKAHGFELFNLTIRRYSTSALPSRFRGRAPGATEFGRVHQGDAMYARDMASGLYEDFAQALSADKILNLTAIFAVFDLPDCAAELALKYRMQLAPLCDVDRVLDLLAMQAAGTKTTYTQYLGQFERQPRQFLGTRNPVVNLGGAWKKAFRKWSGRVELLKRERRGS
jgi:hypothetical protein